MFGRSLSLRSWRMWIVLLALLNTLDVILTTCGINLGIEEGIDASAWLADKVGWGGVLVLKLALIFAFFIFLRMLEKHLFLHNLDPVLNKTIRIIVFMLLLLVLEFLCVVGANLTQIIWIMLIPS